jgi:outer membrane protein OmpA-like peptidoglycan-associated protein
MAMTIRIFLSLSALVFTLAAQSPGTAPPRSTKELDKEIRLGEDEPGCKDSTLLPRLAGCSIIQCDAKDMDSKELVVGASTEGVVQRELMDGPSEVIYYLCPSKLSASAITKQSESALSKAGFKTVYSGKDDEDQPLVTSLKDTQWVQISTYPYNEYSAYVLTAIQDTPETQSTSEALAEEMTKSGRVVLTGFAFEKDKFDLPADAERVLTEVMQLLVRQPTWKILVEGHTDEAGDAQGNVALSQKRASAVASWLLDHGIDRARVSIQGYGGGKPSESADNPRIEIVKL